MEHRLAPHGPLRAGPTRRAAALMGAATLTWAAMAASAALLAIAPAPAWAEKAKPSAGHALAQRQGCLGCHAAQTQLLGPAYAAVAERYRDQKDAAAEVARHIRAGSSGRWGTVPMPPQAQLSEADAGRLAKWILSGAK